MNSGSYAEWLTPERLAAEEELWSQGKLYERYAAAIRKAYNHFDSILSIIELGCGTGWVPTQLDDLAAANPQLSYTLIDQNIDCLRRAVERNKDRKWVEAAKHDLTNIKPAADMICAFAVLKHMALQGWRELFVKLFSEARVAIFTMPLAEQCVDDGLEFHHVRISKLFLWQAIAASGHRVLWADTTDPEEPLFVTFKSSRIFSND